MKYSMRWKTMTHMTKKKMKSKYELLALCEEAELGLRMLHRSTHYSSRNYTWKTEGKKKSSAWTNKLSNGWFLRTGADSLKVDWWLGSMMMIRLRNGWPLSLRIPTRSRRCQVHAYPFNDCTDWGPEVDWRHNQEVPSPFCTDVSHRHSIVFPRCKKRAMSR